MKAYCLSTFLLLTPTAYAELVVPPPPAVSGTDAVPPTAATTEVASSPVSQISPVANPARPAATFARLNVGLIVMPGAGMGGGFLGVAVTSRLALQLEGAVHAEHSPASTFIAADGHATLSAVLYPQRMHDGLFLEAGVGVFGAREGAVSRVGYQALMPSGWNAAFHVGSYYTDNLGGWVFGMRLGHTFF